MLRWAIVKILRIGTASLSAHWVQAGYSFLETKRNECSLPGPRRGGGGARAGHGRHYIEHLFRCQEARTDDAALRLFLCVNQRSCTLTIVTWIHWILE